MAQHGHRDGPAALGTSLHLRLCVSQNTERSSDSWTAAAVAVAVAVLAIVVRVMAMLFSQLLQKMLVNLLCKLI